jgi:manganese/zinc/iron transport system substrate-binding protein
MVYNLSMIKPLSWIFSAILFALILAGCSPESAKEPKSGSNTLKVVATTGMVADMVRAVGGEYVEVTTLMGPGVDPHLYKATPKDIRTITEADLVVVNGLHLEGKLIESLRPLEKEGRLFELAKGIETEGSALTKDGAPDPHVWMDSTLWGTLASGLATFIGEKRPAQADTFAANAKKYEAELNTLTEELKKQLAGIPKERRVLITAHDAFQYFGKRFDIEVDAIQGLSTESEAGLKDVTRLITKITDRKIKAVFIESTLSPKNIEALREGTKARGFPIALGGELYADAMPPGKTYSEMMRLNVNTIVQALK